MIISKIKQLVLIVGTLALGVACTDLEEEIYSTIEKNNYYKTKRDVLNAVYRPMEHGYWSIIPRFESQESPSDQLITPPRDSWYIDGSIWRRFHYHTWTIEDDRIGREWDACFQGIAQVNIVLDDLADLDPAKFSSTSEDFEYFKSQLRITRAWFYIRLLDAYRNLPLTIYGDAEKNDRAQVPPKTIFDFIESELKEALSGLHPKNGTSGNGINQGQWTQGAAAALLVRAYLNAQKWIGEDKYDECAVYAQKIIDGDYGFYALDSRWDAPFDWDNDKSNEVIFAFPSKYGRTHWHYNSADMYWRTVPARANPFFKVNRLPLTNCKYAMSPSMDVDGTPYNHELGGFVAKFKKYPEDYRLIKYKNLGNNKREGMFMFGYIEYEESGQTKRLKSATMQDHDIYLRDQVGKFHNAAPGTIIANKESNMITGGDMNSGWHFAKYPIYPDTESGSLESDFVEIRLAEIYYSLAEVKFRRGDKQGAGKLLNNVRKRNYPTSTHTQYLYAPDGIAELTEAELLDEWGREFLAESRRRTDLCRWNKFSSGRWWDKEPEADNHTEIYPIHRETLSVNPALDQNPGYPGVR